MTKSLCVILLFVPVTLFSQTGSIRGQVTDARTGESLVGANVVVVGSKPGHGAATDVNGMFLMTKIPPGEYVLKASYVDLESVTRQYVKVTTGQTTEVNFALPAEGSSDSPDQTVVDTTVVRKDPTQQAPAEAVRR